MKNLSNYKDHSTVRFGSHLIFDAYGCNPAKLDDLEYCRSILNKCVEVCNMHKMIEPVVIKANPNTAVGGKDPGGNSGFVIIQESHISLHTFSKRGFITMDIYSCKEFDPYAAIDFLKDAFEAKDSDVFFMDRGLKYPTENIV